MTHHSVAPGVLPPQFILKSFLHTILKSVLGIVLEFLTIQRGPPDDTSRWTNKPKWGFICTVIGGEGHKENLLVLTAFLHRSAPFGEGVAFHLRIGLQRDTEWFERLGLFNFDERKVKSVHALLFLRLIWTRLECTSSLRREPLHSKDPPLAVSKHQLLPQCNNRHATGQKRGESYTQISSLSLNDGNVIDTRSRVRNYVFW